MPEYLAPGVYVEEVSFRSKSIEGVPTSTTGFAGLARYGPVAYANGPAATEPRLVTTFTEFERVYGSLDELAIDGGRPCYLAHAARAFFANGGVRLYVSRVYAPPAGGASGVADTNPPILVGAGQARWRARWPGRDGNVLVTTTVARSKNLAFPVGGVTQVRRARAGAVVEIVPAAQNPPAVDATPVLNDLRVVEVANDVQSFRGAGGVAALAADDRVYLLELRVVVAHVGRQPDVYEGLGADPAQVRYAGKILGRDEPEDESAAVWLDWTPADPFDAARLLRELVAAGPVRLVGGDDGTMPGPSGRGGLEGADADPDNADIKATGLAALAELDDIAIVALPDAATYTGLGAADNINTATGALIGHADRLKYRIAVVDAPRNSSLTRVREFRGRFDSTRAALYHPWIEILDPTQRPSQGAPPDKLMLPPSGFVCGVYARTDVERGVHKAPANEVVRGLTRFEANVTKPRQDVLNPEGINALRVLEGRGSRVWGARTMTSDPEWKYVNVRRLFNYIEHSIDRGTQWAVFEPNNARLWANVRQAVEDFLLVLWRDGALLGDTPEEAYFVRCDRTTMTQNDLDNGRLVCLIGVAPTKPAEFVIFRIGQYTAAARG